MMNRLGLLLLPAIAASACAAATSGDPVAHGVGGCHVRRKAKRPPITKVTQPANPYTLFETLQVRPLALSSDGGTLYALNTPDNRLEIFQVTGHELRSVGSVEVGPRADRRSRCGRTTRCGSSTRSRTA